MCNYQYTNQKIYKDRALKNKTICHLAAHYQLSQPTASLPIDQTGKCLFHSKDIAWKRSHPFEVYLNTLKAIAQI